MADDKDDPIAEYAKAFARKGGIARAASMSREARSESGKAGAAARWAGHTAKRPAAGRQSSKSGTSSGSPSNDSTAADTSDSSSGSKS